MIDKFIRLLVVCLTLNGVIGAFDDQQLGYYEFEKAGRNDLPPRVRPPPYLQSHVPCQGLFLNDKYLESSKDTLCGDLKRGYVPLNPMNVIIQDQQYPFELIKNKTLHFLAKSLPRLKEDYESIPKVFKITQQPSETYNELYVEPSSTPTNYRVKRQAKATVVKIDKSELNLNDSTNASRQPNDQNASKKYKGLDSDDATPQESRQKGCDQNDGILCHVLQVLTSNSKSNNDGSLFSTLSQTYQTLKTAKDISNYFSAYAGSQDKSDSAGNEKTDQYSNRQAIAQILNSFSSMNTPTTTPSVSGQDNNFNNPLGAILNYLSGPSSRKKKPAEMDDYINGLTASSSQVSPTVAAVKATPEEQIQLTQPTPCPSIEEYITPVYGRNYQGVWKYVVQIPHEGYFTQTIQKTSCVKGKCDYMDGQCKEASRWVSLLVAEVYYPHAKQPLSNMLPQSSQLKPTVYNELLNSKLNGQPNSAFQVNAVDPNLVNYEMYNTLLNQQPNFNEYNQYDQTFSRRASKHQPTNQPINQATAANQKMQTYPTAAASYAQPQFQDYNLNQPNLNYNQFFNTAQYQQAIKQSTNQPLSQAQAKAQFQQLIDLYQQQITRQQQQQYLQQLAKSKSFAGSNLAAAYSNLMPVENLSTASSMMYPTVISQSSGPIVSQAQHQAQSTSKLIDTKPNEMKMKPRSFDSVNSHNILESTLLKSSYINNDDSMIAAASSNDKMATNEPNTNVPTSSNNQPTSDLNSNTNTNEHNENTSKENNEECDGYDSNGCYVIRVYYDWFLVSGSCKCWKTNKTGSFETLKKMFIGK